MLRCSIDKTTIAVAIGSKGVFINSVILLEEDDFV